jgi:hypothetical protein
MLLDWWASNTYGRQLFIGQGVYRALERNSIPWHRKDELPKQIKAIRENANVQGSIYFSSATFASNPNGWNDSLRNNYYKYPALVPPMHWIDSTAPLAPLFDKLADDQFRIYYRGAEPIKGFAVYKLPEDEDENIDNATLVKIVVADKTADLDINDFPAKEGEKTFISSVDRNNNVSDWVELK